MTYVFWNKTELFGTKLNDLELNSKKRNVERPYKECPLEKNDIPHYIYIQTDYVPYIYDIILYYYTIYQINDVTYHIIQKKHCLGWWGTPQWLQPSKLWCHQRWSCCWSMAPWMEKNDGIPEDLPTKIRIYRGF
jgi:hypothetical protein